MFTYLARVIRVVDGDTCEIQVDLGFRIYHSMMVRLAGINAYELNSKIEDERVLAQQGKEYLIALLTPYPVVKIVSSKPFGGDKYGRYLASIHLPDGTIVNDKMIEQGYAITY